MKKLNNKGFSLVELIIVIAIMAILVGVVGTQVIPYLEKSRKAKDTQVLSGWNTAAVSAYSSEAARLDANAEYKIDIQLTKIDVTSNPADANKCKVLREAFEDLTELDSTKGYDFANDMDSKAGKAVTNCVIVINGKSGQVVTTCTMKAGTSSRLYFDAIENK